MTDIEFIRLHESIVKRALAKAALGDENWIDYLNSEEKKESDELVKQLKLADPFTYPTKEKQ